MSRKYFWIELFVTIAAVVPFYFLLRMCFAAMRFPMELEIREGTGWLHVLAEAEGISIHDHSQIATHAAQGPVDHLFKALVHFLLPILPSHTIARLFVIILPFCMLWFCWEALKGISYGRWAAAFLSASILYISMANLRGYNLLVGRSDPTALSFLCLQAALTARFLYAGKASVISQIIYGLTVSFSFFSVWRIFPVSGSLWLMAAMALRKSGWRGFAKFTAIVAAVFSSAFLFFLFYSFTGSLEVFYAHFIKIFFTYVKVGAYGAWQVFPDEILADPSIALPLLLPLAVLLGSTIFQSYKTRNPNYILAAGLSLACYLVLSYGFNRNKGGGGLHYFSPFLIVVWLGLLFQWASIKTKSWKPATAGIAALGLYLIAVPNWNMIDRQTLNMETNREPVAKFRAQLTELYERDELMSETYHLFKNNLGNSLVDNGDAASDLVRMNLFDQDYADTTQRFVNSVKSGKYRFYLIGGIEHPETGEYIKANYTAIATSPPYDQMNAPGGCVSVINCPLLWQKNGN